MALIGHFRPNALVSGLLLNRCCAPRNIDGAHPARLQTQVLQSSTGTRFSFSDRTARAALGHIEADKIQFCDWASSPLEKSKAADARCFLAPRASLPLVDGCVSLDVPGTAGILQVTFRMKEEKMPSKSANVKNEKQYEALKDKGMSKERAAKIANSPGASRRRGKKSGSGGDSS